MKERESLRRAQILKAVAECVAEEGIDGATMAKIAARAGVSTGLLAYYFKDKRDLIHATLQGYAENLTERTRDAVGPQDDMRRIDAWFDAWFTERDPDSPSWGLWLESWAQASREPELREYFQGRFELGRESFARHLRAGLRGGEIDPDIDPLMAADLLMALSSGLRVGVTLYGDAMSYERAREIARLASRLLKRTSAPAPPED